MNYKEMLNRTIKKSGLKNIELLEKLKEKGVEITPNYLSVLRNSDNKIASEEVSKAIAEVCGAPSSLLVIQGELDRCNDALKTYIEFTLGTIRGTVETLLSFMPEELKEAAMERYKTWEDADFICDVVENPDAYKQTSTDFFEMMPEASKKKYAVVPLAAGDIRIVDENGNAI